MLAFWKLFNGRAGSSVVIVERFLRTLEQCSEIVIKLQDERYSMLEYLLLPSEPSQK
jgi:RNase H-fold protein (predicted Holliday junction resolvase)